MKKNTSGVIGLAKRAGAVTVGAESTLEAIRSGKAKLVLVAQDASDNTKKSIGDKCAFYSVCSEEIDATVTELGSTVGKRPVATVAFTDTNFVKAYRKSLQNSHAD